MKTLLIFSLLAALLSFGNKVVMAQVWSTPEALRAFGQPGDTVRDSTTGNKTPSRDLTPRATPDSTGWEGGSVSILEGHSNTQTFSRSTYESCRVIEFSELNSMSKYELYNLAKSYIESSEYWSKQYRKMEQMNVGNNHLWERDQTCHKEAIRIYEIAKRRQ